MKVEVVQQSFGLLIVADEMFHAVDRRLSIVTDKIVSIEVVSTCV